MEVVLDFVHQPKQETDEDHDFQDDELDLGEKVAEFRQAIMITARRHNIPPCR